MSLELGREIGETNAPFQVYSTIQDQELVGQHETLSSVSAWLTLWAIRSRGALNIPLRRADPQPSMTTLLTSGPWVCHSLQCACFPIGGNVSATTVTSLVAKSP